MQTGFLMVKPTGFLMVKPVRAPQVRVNVKFAYFMQITQMILYANVTVLPRAHRSHRSIQPPFLDQRLPEWTPCSVFRSVPFLHKSAVKSHRLQRQTPDAEANAEVEFVAEVRPSRSMEAVSFASEASDPKRNATIYCCKWAKRASSTSRLIC